ncbi:MAG: hypothetical protein HND52_06910 [Ignavibacteriae bacterium]|nr:hypothetical protein [Ignavibacteriota bacterium]NOG97673.1 hypothetical protein [Ignavibacteriota bacterium]
MKSALITSGSHEELKLILEVSQKMGLKSTMLSNEQIEELSLINAIKEGKTGTYVDKDKFIKSLKK